MYLSVKGYRHLLLINHRVFFLVVVRCLHIDTVLKTQFCFEPTHARLSKQNFDCNFFLPNFRDRMDLWNDETIAHCSCSYSVLPDIFRLRSVSPESK